MKVLIRSLIVTAATGVAGPACAADCSSLDSLRWLLGEWTADGSRTTFHESWSEVGPKTFEGSGIERAKADGAVKGAEVLRLVEMADHVFYISKVTHNELPVSFRLTACASGQFVFENAAHDFPRRIEYRREADHRLVVRVSDGGEKGFTLDFSPVKLAGDVGAAVLAAEDARFAAMIAADSESLRRSLAEDLQYVHLNGDVENREQLIAAISSGSKRYAAMTADERKVVMLGPDAALVRGRGRFQVVAGGKPQDLQLRYLAVYGRVDEDWRLRAWQSLRLPGS
jgi:ketosteroid isomerase-like protein